MALLKDIGHTDYLIAGAFDAFGEPSGVVEGFVQEIHGGGSSARSRAVVVPAKYYLVYCLASVHQGRSCGLSILTVPHPVTRQPALTTTK